MQVHIRVLEASNLAKMDVFTKSDPYVIVRVGGQTQKTNWINNTLNPRWNAEFHFSVGNVSIEKLSLLMRDHDDISSDDDMGKLELPLSSFPVGQVIDQWYDMIPASRRCKKGGRIHLIVHVAPNGAQPFVAAPMMQNSMFANNMMGMQTTMMGTVPPMMGAVPRPVPMMAPQAPMMPPPQPVYRPPYPQPTYPQPVYPQPVYPQPAYPQPAYPQPGYPQPGYPYPPRYY